MYGLRLGIIILAGVFLSISTLLWAVRDDNDIQILTLLMVKRTSQRFDLYQLSPSYEVLRSIPALNVPSVPNVALGWSPDGFTTIPLSWSNDAKWILFGANGCDTSNCPAIYRMWSNGTDVQKLTFLGEPAWGPSWSPDNKWILYHAFVDNPESAAIFDIQIFKARPDGTQRQQITEMPFGAFQSAWSPDGEWIAFVSLPNPDRYDRDIYLIQPNGTALRRLTTSPAVETSPVWSPDGEWIAFLSDDNGDTGIFRVRTNGTQLEEVTDGATNYHSQPTWSPDGRWIYFSATEDHRRGIRHSGLYQIRPNGTEEERLMSQEGYYPPMWSPIPYTDLHIAHLLILGTGLPIIPLLARKMVMGYVARYNRLNDT